MPRVAPNIFAQYYDSAIKLASRETGVSRPELMKKLDITRLMADRVIEQAGLKPVAKVGRTEFFKTPAELPPGVQAAVTVNNAAPTKGKRKAAAAQQPAATPVTVPPPAVQPTPAPAEDTVAEEIQSLDKQIVEVRKLLAADFSERAKIDTRIAGHQALLTALLTQHVTSS